MARLIDDTNQDFLVGTSDNDEIIGLEGNDTVFGLQADDLLFGNTEDDVLYGGQGNDVLFGGQGDDSLFGGKGPVLISGDTANNSYVSFVGSKVFWLGGSTYDQTAIFGYDGSQTTRFTDFLYSYGYPMGGNPVLFTTNNDILRIEGSTATSISPNTTDNQSMGYSSNQDGLLNIRFTGKDSGGYELFSYDNQTLTQYTNEDFTSIGYPRSFGTPVNGKDVLLFDAKKGESSAVYKSDGTTTTKLTPDNFNFASLNISTVPNDQFFIAASNPPTNSANSEGDIFFYDGTNTTKLSNESTKNGQLLTTYSSNTPTILWKGDDGSGFELFRSDGKTTTKITNNNYTDILSFRPVGDYKSNLYAWEASDGTTDQILSYNLETNEIKTLSSESTQNSFIYVNSSNNSQNSNDVYWTGDDGSGVELYRFNGTTTEKLTNQNFAAIDRVQKLDDQKFIISTYNLANQTETGKIFLTDGNTVTEISNPDVQNNQLPLGDFNPSLGVIWTGETTGDGDYFTTDNLFRYDPVTGETTQLTTLGNVENVFSYSTPEYGIFWSGKDGEADGNINDVELFRYDLLTKTTTQLTEQNFNLLNNLQINPETQTAYLQGSLGSTPIGSQIFSYDLTAVPGASLDSFQFTVSNSSYGTSSQIFPLAVV